MTTVFWQGHEVDAYEISHTNNVEVTGAIDAAYERTGMRVGRLGNGTLYSRPAWTPQNEIWHRFNSFEVAYDANRVIWAAIKADGSQVATIVGVGTTQAQLKVMIGGVLTAVGAAFALQPTSTKCRYDVHIKGTADGKVELYYGAVGSQAKVVDATGDYSGAGSITRIFHGCNAVGGSFDTDVSHEIVQDTSTLSSTSEIKPPTSNGTDVDGTGTWADVDEIVYSDVDMITLGTAGQRQSFKSAARTQTQAVVTGITISARAWYEAGGPTKMKPYLTIAGVRYYGQTFSLDVIPLAYQHTFLTNPATGVLFTTAEANAATLEWGWEAVA